MDDDTRTEDLPAPIKFVVDDHAVTVTYEQNWGVTARIGLPPELLRLMDSVVAAAYDVVDPSLPTWRYSWVVVDEAGNEVVSSPVPSSLQYYYDEHVKRERREQNYDTLNADLTELMEQVRDLRGRDLPVTAIEQALRAARDAVGNLYGYWKATTFSQAQAAMTRVRRLISELEGSFVSVVVRGLMSGDIYHRDVYWNRQVRQRQLSLWIRVGGDTPLQEYLGEDAMDLLTDDRVAAIYADRLTAADAKTLSEVNKTDLALDLDTYAPEWLLKEPSLQPSPDVIVFATSRKDVTAHVTYSLRDDGGLLIPTGTARITLNEYRSAKSIPTLTHGIELALELTVSGEVVVRGPVGDVLTKRVKGYRGGQRRSSAVPAGDLIRTQPIRAGEAPPWLVSRRAVRWR